MFSNHALHLKAVSEKLNKPEPLRKLASKKSKSTFAEDRLNYIAAEAEIWWKLFRAYEIINFRDSGVLCLNIPYRFMSRRLQPQILDFIFKPRKIY